MTKPSFSVEQIGNIIVTRISGDWNLQADISYLTLLDETIAKVRDENWALFADLRGWRVSEEVANYKHNDTIQLARRNQQAECWLVDDASQGQHIQHHIKDSGVPFQKFFDKEEAQKWLKHHGYIL